MTDKPIRPQPVAGTGRLAGYVTLPGWDPFEDRIGPLFESADGARTAMELSARHCNTAGIVHGGALMTFADFTLFVVARSALGGVGGATVSLTSDFTAPARDGELLEGEGEIVRETGSMLFLRGREFVDERTVLSFSAIVKKPRKR